MAQQRTATQGRKPDFIYKRIPIYAALSAFASALHRIEFFPSVYSTINYHSISITSLISLAFVIATLNDLCLTLSLH